jgi:catechol 2,3-dioxygenase-like lactoylglutathione lyase family enzyme
MSLLVNIDVDDLAKGIGFYSAAFGLRVGRRFGTFGVELLGSSAPIYLLVKGEGTPAAETTSRLRASLDAGSSRFCR